MPSADRKEPGTVLIQKATEDMEKYGITRTVANYFHCGDVRYTNLKDAVGQAKRQ